MRITLHKRFVKMYTLLRPAEKKKFQQRRDIFLKDLFNAVLHNHELSGLLKGYRSINITGDIRVIYKEERKGVFHFIRIGTHSELYE